jgi:DNA topoisomerase IB
VALAGEPPPPSEAAGRRTIAAAVRQVAEALGNTPAVCRRSYIDPRVFDRFRNGETIDLGAPANGRLGDRRRNQIEKQVLALIG